MSTATVTTATRTAAEPPFHPTPHPSTPSPTATHTTPLKSQQILGNPEPPAITYEEFTPTTLEPHTPTPSAQRQFRDPARDFSARLVAAGEAGIREQQPPRILALQIPTPLRGRHFSLDSATPYAPSSSQDPRDPLAAPRGAIIIGTEEEEQPRQRYRSWFDRPPPSTPPAGRPSAPPPPPPPGGHRSSHGGGPPGGPPPPGYPVPRRSSPSVPIPVLP